MSIKKLEKKLNIAVVGSGIAGLSAAWLLQKAHKVRVYEKESRIGGHCNTVDVPSPRQIVPIDTGFIVFNEQNYPNFSALLKHFDVAVKNSEMSFSASLDNGDFEYSGTSLNGLFGQRRNIFRPRFWKMIFGIYRFYQHAPQILEDSNQEEISLGQFLKLNKYGDSVVNDHLFPMGSAIWSSAISEIEKYPARSFVSFFKNHGLLKIRNRPQWKTIVGGSREYVKSLVGTLKQDVRFGGVKSIKRGEKEVFIETKDGFIESFDHVVIATHADEAFKLLSDPDQREAVLLGSWKYSTNNAILHGDPLMMPKRKRVWSSWNVVTDKENQNGEEVCLTYWMNKLQGIIQEKQIFVTLNPHREIQKSDIFDEFVYTHPIFDCTTLANQKLLWSLQGHQRTWYCGSYFGSGFHEDALQSGLAVAEQLGNVKRPWVVENESDRITMSSC